MKTVKLTGEFKYSLNGKEVLVAQEGDTITVPDMIALGAADCGVAGEVKDAPDAKPDPKKRETKPAAPAKETKVSTKTIQDRAALIKELCQLKGISPARAATLIDEFKVQGLQDFVDAVENNDRRTAIAAGMSGVSEKQLVAMKEQATTIILTS